MMAMIMMIAMMIMIVNKDNEKGNMMIKMAIMIFNDVNDNDDIKRGHVIENE